MNNTANVSAPVGLKRYSRSQDEEETAPAATAGFFVPARRRGKVTQPVLSKTARRRAAILSRLKLYGPRPTEAERQHQNKQILLVVVTFFLIGYAISLIDPGYLEAAWLSVGALGVAIYFTKEAKRPAINVYTVLFGVCIVGCLAGFALTRGWLI